MSEILHIYLNGAPRRPTLSFHWHKCPECYESKWCLYLTCTLEEDQTEMYGGKPHGCIAVCEDCRPHSELRP